MSLVTELAGLTSQEWAAFHALGDANRDGYINNKDVAIVTAAMGASLGSPTYNADADINGDGVVNILDLILVEKNQGLNIWSYYNVPKPVPVKYVAAGVSIVAVAALAGYYLVKKRR